jgi:hypothetical protein
MASTALPLQQLDTTGAFQRGAQGLVSLATLGMQRQAQQQALQEGSIKLQQLQQEQQDQQATRAAVSGGVTTNPDGSVSLDQGKILSQLYQTAPTQGLNLQNQFAMNALAMQKSQADLQKTTLENSRTKVDLLGQLAGSVTDQASYDAATKQAVQLGLIHPGDLPPVYDPQMVRQVQINALTAKDHIDAQQKQLDFQLQEQNAAETARHNATTEGLTASAQAETARHDKNSEGIERTGQQIQLRQQNLGVENDLRSQFDTTTKPFQTQAEAFNNVQTASKKGAIGDLDLMYNALKMMNPSGNVRPGALQSVQDANSPLGKLQLAWNNNVTGAAKLTDNQRADIISQVSDLYKTAEQQQQQAVQSFRNIAARNGANPDNVAPEFRSVFSPQQASESQHQVGDVVTVGNKKLRITKIGANGNAEGIPVP